MVLVELFLGYFDNNRVFWLVVFFSLLIKEGKVFVLYKSILGYSDLFTVVWSLEINKLIENIKGSVFSWVAFLVIFL